MTRFASEKRALGICDRCGFTYPLRELLFEYIRDRRVNFRVCPECYDPDHPQDNLGESLIFDPQALQFPRPDNKEYAAVRAIMFTVHSKPMKGDVGQVTVVIS